MTFDYTSIGFYTMDALCRPVTKIPEGGNTIFVDDFTIAVSGAAGASAIVAAKHGLSVQAVGGIGEDLMGDWVLQRLSHFGIDLKHMQRCPGYSTSCSIVTTRPDGARPALHKHGATGGFFVEDDQLDSILDTKILHVGGVGLMDRMGDWVLQRLSHFGIDLKHMQRCPGYSTSCSIVTTRPDGARPALHKHGATGGFFIEDDQIDSILKTKILHVGGVGLMDRMDHGRTVEVMTEAKARGCVTTLDVFASTSEDLSLVAPLLPYTDYFMPSEEEAMALSGLSDFEEIAQFLLDQGAGAVILTMGEGGVIYRDKNATKIDLPSFMIDVVCTCGCGDSFNAGFATGLHLNKTMEDCLYLGQASSAQNALGLGSQAVIQTLEQTLTFIETTSLRE